MSGPLVVQSDRTMLLEVDHDEAEACRAAIAPFAELERSPEHVHTYRLTPLGLWNARAAGLDAEQVVDALIRFSRYQVPNALLLDLAEVMDRYGRLVICDDPVHGLVLRSIDEGTVVVHGTERGRLKQVLIKVGWPAEDRAAYVAGAPYPIALAEGADFRLREYQQQAVEGFFAGGSGVVVLPCGAGKTAVGMAAMARASAMSLILVTNTVAARQWRAE